jgi:NAD(P)-dependent dehydrogenase (short-subunit alcohol dehydrogenase family)
VHKHVHHATPKIEADLMARLDGKIAVITGGSSGIGLATAQRFTKEGAYVFITGRRQSELDKAKALIGRRVTTVAGDASKLVDLDKLFATVLEEKSWERSPSIISMPPSTSTHGEHFSPCRRRCP